MFENESSSESYPKHQLPGSQKRFHWRMGLTILVAGTAATIAANRFSDDNTYRVIRTFYGIGATYAAVVAWWMLFSGLSFKTRVLTLISVTLLGAAALKLFVKKVPFDGAMRPHLQFVWDAPSPSDIAQKWLAEHAPTARSAAADESRLTVTEFDWPHYCGARGDREIRETQCSFDWKATPPKELWRRPVGDAWSSFSAVGDRLWTQEQRGELECVACYQTDTGQELWRHEDKTRYETSLGAAGPRATPTVTEDTVFSLGATGILNALNPVSGTLLWQRNVCRDAGSEMVEWGMSGSPLVHDRLVIVDAGGNNGRAVIAYDRQSGDIVWATDSHQAGYMSPRIERIADRLQLLIFHGDGLASFDPSDGTKLWSYPWANQYKINVAQPILYGQRIFISSGYESGCILLDPTRLAQGRPEEVWAPNKNLKLKFNEAVRKGDFVYGLDDGILACVDLKTGKRLWKGGRYRYGQVLLWGDKLVIQAESGQLAIVEATPESYSEVAQLDALHDRTWNVPVVHRGRLYVRNAAEAACFSLPTEDK